MAAVLGLNLLLKVDTTGGGAYSTVGGIKNADMTINGETVDTTSQDDTSRWRQLIAGGGIKSMSLSGDGVLKNAAVDTTVRTYMLNNTIRNWQIVVPGAGTYTALFAVTSYKNSGAHNDAVMFSISVESAGDVSFA